jgi:hypothetical protein
LNELLNLFANAYADDVLIYLDSESEEVYYSQVKEVIYRLHYAGLQGDIKKCKFNITIINYLDIIIKAGKGIRIDPKKIETIINWRFENIITTTVLRLFLGLINFVRIFFYHISDLAEPLNKLLKKDIPFKMGPEQRKSFKHLKRLACEAPVLVFFVPSRETKMKTDTLHNTTGGMIL